MNHSNQNIFRRGYFWGVQIRGGIFRPTRMLVFGMITMFLILLELRRISCHRRNYSQPNLFKRDQSSDTRSHGFGAKFLL